MLENCENELNSIIKYFNEKMNKAENKKKYVDYVKIHITDKSGLYIVTTKKRSELLKSLNLDGMVINIRKTNANNQYSIENNKITSLCDKYFKAKNRLKEIIQEKYIEVLKDFEDYSQNIYDLSKLISCIDILQNKVYITNKYNYCKPIISENDNKSFISAKSIRHPLLEHIQQDEIYVTNDISLGSNNDEQNGICLFGTNAVGKTSFIKSIGLNIILAQAGFFVSCQSFDFYPYKQLFTRILNNDNMFKGLSTFAVEMCELRTILTMANNNSLILGDELCSGTENISAISIFIAGLKKLHHCESSFIFATHFHEINHLDDVNELNKLKMKHLSVVYDHSSNKLIYDRKIKDGSGDSIYGLEVCKSLLLPDEFLEDAYIIRKKYLNIKDDLELKKTKYNSNKLVRKICELCNKNMSNEIHHLHYQNLANDNNYINNNFHKNHRGNLISICETCHNNIHKNEVKYSKKKTLDGELILC